MSRLMSIQMDWWSPVATFTRINLDELYPEALKSAFCCWTQASPQQPKSIYYEPWMAEFQIEKLFELIIRTSLNWMSAMPGHFSPSTSTETTCDSCQMPEPHLQAPIKGSFNFVSWQRDSKHQCWDSQATRDISYIRLFGQITVTSPHLFTQVATTWEFGTETLEIWSPASFIKGLHLPPLMKKKVWRRHFHFCIILLRTIQICLDFKSCYSQHFLLEHV